MIEVVVVARCMKVHTNTQRHTDTHVHLTCSFQFTLRNEIREIREREGETGSKMRAEEEAESIRLNMCERGKRDRSVRSERRDSRLWPV